MGTLSPLFAVGAGLAFFAIWFGLALWIGLTAERRGYNARIWFGFAVFATPLVALVLLALITPRDGRGRMP